MYSVSLGLFIVYVGLKVTAHLKDAIFCCVEHYMYSVSLGLLMVFMVGVGRGGSKSG